MVSEQKNESCIPKQYRWRALLAAREADVLRCYRQALVALGDPAKTPDKSIVAIFQSAMTTVRVPANLRRLIDAIDGLQWFSDNRDAFEGLLQKMAEETKRGAGQYFTPRVLVKVIVGLMQPQVGEVIQDPAVGTGGFLIAANEHMKTRTDDSFGLRSGQATPQFRDAFRAIENVPDTYRLLLMNLHLHKMDPQHIELGDTHSPAGSAAAFKNADLILTNAPFGPAGAPPTRDDFTITDQVSSYQLPFVEHRVRALRLGGRAAIVVPDNILFDDGKGKDLRRMLMNRCDLHTVLRLPTGIFYAQSVKTNVLFFTRSDEEAPTEDATKAVWIYDMRCGVPAYGKTRPINADDFAAFGGDLDGSGARTGEGEEGRFRRFTREELSARGDNIPKTVSKPPRRSRRLSNSVWPMQWSKFAR
jgi:type I restriction enzyme M protein